MYLKYLLGEGENQDNDVFYIKVKEKINEYKRNMYDNRSWDMFETICSSPKFILRFHPLFLHGEVVISGVNTSPSISYSNSMHCTVLSIDNIQLVLTGTEYMLTFHVEIIPMSIYSSCTFDFTVPKRTTKFSKQSDITCMVSGYTSTDIVLSSTLGRSVPTTTTARISFQSVDTSTHTIQVLSRYTNI
jgi:hypothetical protein